jgi:hypothetical protein
MARKALRSNPKRKASWGASNKLHDAAVQSNDRMPIPRTDYDHRRNVSELGWRELMSAARFIYGNHPDVQGAVDQMVNLAVGQTFRIQYTGRNRAWGEEMEASILEHDKVCDVRGYPFDFAGGIKLDITSIIRDGDSLGLMVENEDEFPLYQGIPSHRVGARGVTTEIVEDGKFKGSQIVNGVIMNEVGRIIGLRIYSGDNNADTFEDVGIESAIFTFEPRFYDQARGVTWFFAAINTLLDRAEVRKFLQLGIKAEAATALIEENEAGGAMDTARARQSAKPTPDNPKQPFVQELYGGQIRYFKSGTGSKITAVNSRRPATETMNFDFELLRASLESIGWPIEMYDPSRSGGAPTRLRIAMAAKTLERIQKLAKQIAYRKHLFTISHKIKRGELSPDPDFFKFTHQMPGSVTADYGRDVKADLQMYLIGAITLSQLAAFYGNDSEDVLRAKGKEARMKYDIAKAEDVPVTDLQLLTPNANDPSAVSAMPEKEKPSTDQKP